MKAGPSNPPAKKPNPPAAAAATAMASTGPQTAARASPTSDYQKDAEQAHKIISKMLDKIKEQNKVRMQSGKIIGKPM